MNLFMPYEIIEMSVQALDDKRLNKQILECHQMLQVALGHSTGYANHPVVKHYCKYPLACHIYAIDCCIEWHRRFGKSHELEDAIGAINAESLLARSGAYPYCDTFLYAEHPANDMRCIRTTDIRRVTELFKDKLVRKWKQDIANGRPPRWTNRIAPEFWRMEVEE